jgi:hypothetical protein
LVALALQPVRLSKTAIAVIQPCRVMTSASESVPMLVYALASSESRRHMTRTSSIYQA